MLVVKYTSENKLLPVSPVKKAENTQKTNLSVGNLLEESVEVVISKEGMEEYRSSIAQSKSSETEAPKDFKEALPDGAFASRARYRLTGMFHEINENKKKENRYLDTIEGHAATMLEAYAVLYDEIIRGYEDGTRATYEVDESLPGGCRLLTKEEELELLDQTYKDIMHGYEMKINGDQETMKGWVETYRKVAEEISRRRGRTEKYLEFIGKAESLERRIKEENLPENFAAKMIQGAALFKNQYAGMFDKNVVYNIFEHMEFYNNSKE